MKFCFGDIVIVDGNCIGVIVKSWINTRNNEHTYEVYVRMYNRIVEYKESDIERHMVRHKYLNDEDMEYQRNAIVGM